MKEFLNSMKELAIDVIFIVIFIVIFSGLALFFEEYL